MDRRLQDSLFLIVKRNRNDKAWQFPQGKFLEEDTHMRGVRHHYTIIFDQLTIACLIL